MKTLNIKAKDLKFWKNWDLLDGQKRGEVVFRRLFVVAVGYVVLLLIGVAYGDQVKSYLAGDNEVRIEAAEEVVEVPKMGVDGVGNVVEDGEVVNGQEVVVEDGEARYKQEYKEKSDMDSVVESFIFNVYKGAYSYEYFELLRENCSDEGLRTVIALSVAESSMGKNTNRNTNWYGWFKGGDRNYDPSQEEMAKEICKGIEDNYLGIGTDMSKATRYVGGDSTNWMKNFNWAYNQMGTK